MDTQAPLHRSDHHDLGGDMVLKESRRAEGTGSVTRFKRLGSEEASAGERISPASSLPLRRTPDHSLAAAAPTVDGLALWCNEAWPGAPAPRLSVLVPFRDEDCRPLVEGIIGTAGSLAAPLELVVGDDGTPEPGLGGRVQERLAATAVPAALLFAAQNLGRAAIRNRLADCARGDHVLFVDAGMEIPGPEFLAWYLARADGTRRLIFGGYAAKPEVLARADALAACEFQRDQCLSASVRSRRPWQHVYGGNLLVHRQVFAACPFDEGFRGWGWEDVEMGVRAARLFPVEHIDNPVFRTTLPTAADLVSRFSESAPNFARFAALHPREAAELPMGRAARITARLPLRRPLARVLRRVILRHRALIPVRLRLLALKLFRACLYADGLAVARRAGSGSSAG